MCVSVSADLVIAPRPDKLIAITLTEREKLNSREASNTITRQAKGETSLPV